jgi:predicted nucleic acid-binding protein
VDVLTGHLIDTMAVVRYLDDSLPPHADKVFREAEADRGHLFLPEIALAEFAHNVLSSPFLSISAMSPRA